MKKNVSKFDDFVEDKKSKTKVEETETIDISNDTTKTDDKNLKDNTFNFLIKTLGYRNQLRINHWQTEVYMEHKMTDDLMDTIDEKVDAIGETTLGLFGRPKIEKQNNEVTNITSQTTKEIIDSIHKDLCELIEQYKETEFEGMISLLGDFCADIEKFKYLCTFSE